MRGSAASPLLKLENVVAGYGYGPDIIQNIDLELNKDRELLEQIILDSDVLIESYAPGELSSYGIDLSDLINKKTIGDLVSFNGSFNCFLESHASHFSLFASGLYVSNQ